MCPGSHLGTCWGIWSRSFLGGWRQAAVSPRLILTPAFCSARYSAERKLLVTSLSVWIHLCVTHGKTTFQSSGAADGAYSDLLPNLATEHPQMAISAMEDVRRKKIERSKWYHVSDTPPVPWQERGDVNVKTNHNKPDRELNQNGRILILWLGRSTVAPWDVSSQVTYFANVIFPQSQRDWKVGGKNPPKNKNKNMGDWLIWNSGLML